ncbi:histone H2B.1, embryonic-like [Carcharodon carcharias]|uniref:histone H2B.1, embryonic-like n=1 Tax=Carcharodon carcharias TaxID=13397 RepID=UPI001B7EE1F7|nr:histone H2B.1, embryonic-like [Carcharodon carcharias]
MKVQVSKKDVKKAHKKLPAKGSKKRKISRKESYSIYIYKVMKQVHPNTGKSMRIKNSFVNYIFECITGNKIDQLKDKISKANACTQFPGEALIRGHFSSLARNLMTYHVWSRCAPGDQNFEGNLR